MIGMPPKASPSLSDYPDCDAEVRAMAKGFGRAGAKGGQGGSSGRGKVLHDSSAFRWAKENPLAEARWIWATGSNEPGENKETARSRARSAWRSGRATTSRKF